MNPFEQGMVAADALHGVMDKRIARKIGRNVRGRRRPFFYNPFWSRMGDFSRGAPGTFYRAASGDLTAFFWNSFDQALLRPDILDFFDESKMLVLDKAGSRRLVASDKAGIIGSDHLPIFIDVATELGVRTTFEINEPDYAKESLG
jgi:hypothetical protein